MIEQKDVMQKLRNMAAMFDFYCRRKEYWKAVKQREMASQIAVFMKLEEKEMIELFGDGGYREDGEIKIKGLFSQTKCSKAVLEACIKQKHDTQKLTYQEVMEMWQKKRT